MSRSPYSPKLNMDSKLCIMCALVYLVIYINGVTGEVTEPSAIEDECQLHYQPCFKYCYESTHEDKPTRDSSLVDRIKNTENVRPGESMKIVLIVICILLTFVSVYWTVYIIPRRTYRRFECSAIPLISKYDIRAVTDLTNPESVHLPPTLQKHAEPDDGEPEILSSKKESSSNPEQSERTNKEEDLQEEQIRRLECKICLHGILNIVLLPCNHMVACERCSMLLERCPMCRCYVKATMPVYISE